MDYQIEFCTSLDPFNILETCQFIVAPSFIDIDWYSFSSVNLFRIYKLQCAYSRLAICRKAVVTPFFIGVVYLRFSK